MTRVDLIADTILACCVLHNICLDNITDDDDEDIENYILNGEVINEINADNNEEYGEDIGINKRDYIAHTLRHYN